MPPFARVVARVAIGLLAITLTGADARAQQPEAESGRGALERAGISGSIRAGYWTSTRDLDAEDHVVTGAIWLKAARPVTNRLSFLIESWTTARRPSRDATGAVREAFVDVQLGRLDLRAGRQIVAWGRADGLNPTDNLTGEDLTLLFPDDHDRRLGATALRASYYVAGLSLSGVWLPEFSGHRFPLPPAPAGVTYYSDRPEWPGDQWAVRLERTGGAMDWSLSYFRGLDLFPDLAPGEIAESPSRFGVVRESHHRVRILGADMAANVGRFGLRAEAAFTDTEDATGTDPFTKNPFLFVVVGADRTFHEDFNLNVQYLTRIVIDHQPMPVDDGSFAAGVAAQQAILNSQVRRVQHGMSFRAGYTALRETLEVEWAAAGYFAPGGVALRPKITYAISDAWKAIAGAEIYRGEPTSVFGLLRPNSSGFLELRWSF